ncbi:MAG TPA: hypothetical protein VFM21_06195 [Terriglobia bacterium]|nr:hypothetical protein [Terriglobia bacterium]
MATKKPKPKPKRKKRPRPKIACPRGLFTVHIKNTNGQTAVDHYKIDHVRKNIGDEVKWIGDGDFTVDFNYPEGSPFATSHYSGGKGNPQYSGGVVSSTYTDFRYTAQIAGATPLDPIIHTDP